MKKLFLTLLLLSATAWGMAAPKVLTYNSGAEPDSLDPNLTATVDANNLSRQMFEGLVAEHPKEVRVVPGVAEKWVISPDGKTYTFYLRKNAKWSDGTPVTATDFVYAWERVLNPKTGSQQASRLQWVKNGKAYLEGKLKDPKQLGFKAVDPYTFQVELEGPFPPFLELAAQPTLAPVKKEVVEKFGDLWTRPENFVCNGPFILKEWKAYDQLKLVKNPNYWDAKNVALDEINALVVEDLETALKQFNAGQIDFVEMIPMVKIPTLKGNPEFYSSPSFGLYYYPINTTHPVLKDPRIRRALALAIDRKTLVEKVIRGGQDPAVAIIPPGVPGYPYAKLVDFDPATAKKLLAEAGYPDGAGFPKITVSYNTMDSHKVIAETIQQMWKQTLGIQIGVVNNDWKVHVANLHNHNFEIARFGGIGEYAYPSTFLESFVSTFPGNETLWKNTEFDRLWDVASREASPKKRLQIYGQMEKLVMNEMPVIPIYYYNNNWLTKKRVEGLHLKPMHTFVLKNVTVR